MGCSFCWTYQGDEGTLDWVGTPKAWMKCTFFTRLCRFRCFQNPEPLPSSFTDSSIEWVWCSSWQLSKSNYKSDHFNFYRFETIKAFLESEDRNSVGKEYW